MHAHVCHSNTQASEHPKQDIGTPAPTTPGSASPAPSGRVSWRRRRRRAAGPPPRWRRWGASEACVGGGEGVGRTHGEKAGDLWREMGSDFGTPGREAQWTAAVDPPADNSHEHAADTGLQTSQGINNNNVQGAISSFAARRCSSLPTLLIRPQRSEERTLALLRREERSPQ